MEFVSNLIQYHLSELNKHKTELEMLSREEGEEIGKANNVYSGRTNTQEDQT
jgi:hypothetical protein